MSGNLVSLPHITSRNEKEKFISWYIQVISHILFAVALLPNASHGLLIFEVTRSHITTHHSR
jgi:hypothetical protein